jgi:hypothetical protein
VPENLRINSEQNPGEHSVTQEQSETGEDVQADTDEIAHAPAPEAGTAMSADIEEEPAEEAPDPVQPEKPGIISADEFNAAYNKRGKTLTAEVAIRNIDPDSNRVAGHAILIFKRGTDPRRWITLPPSDLVEGRPTGEQIGEEFAISRFKTLKFEAENISDPKPIKTATLFIFTQAGELMLEKDFPLMITE